MPALAFFRINYDIKIVFPEQQDLNYLNIIEFITDYLEKPLTIVADKYSSLNDKLRK